MTPDATEHVLANVQESDIGAMARIHAQSFDEAWSGVMMRRILSMPGTFGIVARVNRQRSVSGFALARVVADECELLSLAIAPEHRGFGVGRMLLGAAMARARAASAESFFLEVAEDNAVALALYRAHGLIEVGHRPDYYRRRDGGATAALTMRCSLAVTGVTAAVGR